MTTISCITFLVVGRNHGKPSIGDCALTALPSRSGLNRRSAILLDDVRAAIDTANGGPFLRDNMRLAFSGNWVTNEPPARELETEASANRQK